MLPAYYPGIIMKVFISIVLIFNHIVKLSPPTFQSSNDPPNLWLLKAGTQIGSGGGNVYRYGRKHTVE